MVLLRLGALLVWPTLADPGDCIAPAVCEPPTAAFSKVQPVQSRSQWTDSGGYCGALSVQAIAMSYGAYISQAQVRLATGGGQGETGMVMNYNIQKALDKLKLTH